VVLGGVLFGTGLILAGFVQSLPGLTSLYWLYLTYGVMVSIGSGAAYGAAVGASVKWFPDRRGMASGLVVGALGFGPVIIAPVAQYLIKDTDLGIMGVFKLFGGVFLAIILLAACFITSPPKGYCPKGYTPKPSGSGSTAPDLTWKRMLGKGKFWLLYILYACGAFSGLMIISQIKPMAMSITHLGEMQAAGIVMALAAANASGRVVWGSVSDKIGRYTALALMFLLTAVAMFLLSTLAGAVLTLILDVVLIGLCYGGYLGLFPSICAESFGEKNLTVNYGLLFSAFSLAGILGPYIGAMFAPPSGMLQPHDYPRAFLIAGALAVCGMLLSLVVRAGASRSAVKPSA